jgi:hypothetical protein
MADLGQIIAEARRIGLLSADDRLDCDLMCGQCGYNLRTLLLDRNCPECNAPVAETVEARVFVPQRWLERVGRGATILAVSGVLLLGFAVLLATQEVSTFPGFEHTSPSLLVLLAGGTALAGLMMVTASPPRGPQAARGSWSARRAVRLATACAGAGLLALLVCGWVGVGLEVIALCVLGACFVLLSTALLRHLAFLAESIGRAPAARSLRIAGWFALFGSAALVAGLARYGGLALQAPSALIGGLAATLGFVLAGLFVPAALALNRAAWPDVPALPGDRRLRSDD